MNRSEAQHLLKHIDVLKAFAEGQDVQYDSGDDMGWCDTQTPVFTSAWCTYRIKPRPVEGWVGVYDDNSISRVYATKAQAERYALSAARWLFVREVEPTSSSKESK